jgi:hypothetical protein
VNNLPQSLDDFLKSTQTGSNGLQSIDDFLGIQQEPDQQPTIPSMTPSEIKNRFGVSNFVDVTQSPRFKEIEQTPVVHGPPVPDTRSGVERTLDYIFKENPVMRVINAPFAYGAQKAADMPYLDGKTDELGFRSLGERMAAQNPVASTGNATIDNIAKKAGDLIAPFYGMQGLPSSVASIPLAQVTANRIGAQVGTGLGGKLASSVATGAMEGAYQGFGGELATDTNPTAGKLAESTAFGVGAGAGLGVLGKLAGSALGSAVERFKARKATEVAPEVQQATQRVFNEYRKPAGPQTLDDVTKGIMDEVNQRITPPLENPKLLDKYLRQHLGEDIPKNELDGLSYNDKAELAQYVKDSLDVHDVASQVAKERGYNWSDMVGARTEPTQSANHVTLDEIIAKEQPVTEQPVTTNTVTKPVTEQPAIKQANPTVDGMRERGHSQTVRLSDMTPEPLKDVFSDPELYKTRSTVKLHEDAQKYIAKNGLQNAYDFVMGAKKMTDKHNAVAQVIAKQLANSGDISRAIDVVSKTAKSGTELGRAIQALSLWNRMDTEGAILLAQRQLNRGNKGEYVSLTPEQAQPIVAATEKIRQVEQTKSLAEEVMDIVANKPAGEKLTDAEVAKIKEFQKQVSEIDGKVKKFLPEEKAAKPRKVVQEIDKVKPEERTRDQIVSYWDARAEIARQKLAKQRNVGIIANTENPVLLYAELGVAKLVKGAVKLADFTEQMVREYGESVKSNIHQVYNKSVDLFRKSQGLPTNDDLTKLVNKAVKDRKLDELEASRLQAWAKDIAFYTDDNLRTEAVQDLQLALKAIGDSTLGQKISTLQTGAQLLNAVTIERNVIGNVASLVAEKVNKVVAVPIDWTFSRLTGERTVKFNPLNQESMWRNYMIGTKSGWKGVSPNGMLNSYDIRPEVFGNKNPLKYITKSLGATMQGFDHAFYRSAYGDVLATYAEQLGKSQGLTRAQIKAQMPDLLKQLDQSIYDLADEAGRYATYQDDTLLSHGAEMLKRGLNKLTDKPVSMIVDKGLLPKSLSTEGFGLGDIVLKYAKTPANLIMRGIDYSPIGILRGMMELAPLVLRRGTFDQYEATRALSRAITGTLGLTGVGYLLADAGILTGSSSMDKDMRSIQEQSGQGAYKVNWSALGRYLTNGFDKNAAKFQPGDHVMDYAWLQPAAISVAMGVNANKAVKERKDGYATGWKVAEKALLGGLASVLENPMVQGISNVIDAGTDIIKKNDATKAKGLIKGVPASFVPTLLNQARTATDNQQRETYSKDLLTEMGNLIKNKLPGLSKTLPVSNDSLGNPRERIQGGQENTVRQYLTSFFSPAKLTEYEVSDEAKMVLDLMNDSNDQTILPRIVDKYLYVDDPITKKQKKIDLNAEQFSKLQQKVGKEVTRKLQLSANYLSNPSIRTDVKVKRVKDILSEVGAKARNDLRAEMGYKRK